MKDDNFCVIRYDVQSGGNRVVITNSIEHRHNVSIPRGHLSVTLFGHGRNGRYNKTFKVGDAAEYSSDDRFSYYGKIKSIHDNYVIIETGKNTTKLEMAEFSMRNHCFDQKEADLNNLKNTEF